MAEQKATNITWHEGYVTPAEGEKLWIRRAPPLDDRPEGIGQIDHRGAFSNRCCARSKARLSPRRRQHSARPEQEPGFSAEDRAENIRRIGEVAKLFADAGVITITRSSALPAGSRRRARPRRSQEFLEVYVKLRIEPGRKTRSQGFVQESPQQDSSRDSPASTIPTKRRNRRNRDRHRTDQCRRRGQGDFGASRDRRISQA